MEIKETNRIISERRRRKQTSPKKIFEKSFSSEETKEKELNEISISIPFETKKEETAQKNKKNKKADEENKKSEQGK